jgi:hypothetical protein
MSELSLTIIRVAFLAVLWLFVIAAIGVVRTDLLGGPSTSSRRSRGRQTQNLRPPRRAPGRSSTAERYCRTAADVKKIEPAKNVAAVASSPADSA